MLYLFLSGAEQKHLTELADGGETVIGGAKACSESFERKKEAANDDDCCSLASFLPSSFRCFRIFASLVLSLYVQNMDRVVDRSSSFFLSLLQITAAAAAFVEGKEQVVPKRKGCYYVL